MELNTVDLSDLLADIGLIPEMEFLGETKPKARYLEYREEAHNHWWVQVEISASQFLDGLLAFKVEVQKQIIEALQLELDASAHGRIVLEWERTSAKGGKQVSSVQINRLQKADPHKRPETIQIIPA